MPRWMTAVILATACAKPATPAPAPDAAPPPATATATAPAPVKAAPPALYVEMVGHYDAAITARDALIRGDVAKATQTLADMGRHQVHPGLSDSLKMYAFGMKASAHEVHQAGNAGQVGEVLGQTVMWCGKCHTAAGVQFDFRPEPVAEGDTVLSHMVRHQWVADRFWDALVEPSDDAWAQGTAVLNEDALAHDDVKHEGDRHAAVDAMARLVHTLGLDAQEASERIDKAGVMGAFYATCSDCHSETRNLPQK